MTTYSLNAFELQMLVLAAERRNCGKQPNGVQNRKVDKKLSDFSINLHGVAGEYAVGKLLGIKIDTSINLSGDDKIADLEFDGATIQVKTIIGARGKNHLYFKSIDAFKADVAVLTVMSNATDIEVLGWITKERFRNSARTLNFGYNDILGLESSELENPEYLKQYLETL